MLSPLSPRARAALVHRLMESRLRRGSGEVLRGHHNVNYILPLGIVAACLLGTRPFALIKYRVPRKTVEVVPRTWQRESDVLQVVCRHLPEVPRCLLDLGDRSVHDYRAGRVLSDENPDGRVGEALMRSFAEFFVRIAQVPVAELPPRPAGWPDDGNSVGFLHWLVDFSEERVHKAHRDRFGSLFADMGIAEGVMADFKRRHGRLTSRPFRLLHSDVHRANVVLRRGQPIVIDWELALFGDPVHDLATHLVRMKYGKQERVRATEMWFEAMSRAGYGDLTAGVDADLPVYMAFEYAQSVFPDVMRAALGLPRRPKEEEFLEAGQRIRSAVGRAREPLRLVSVPDLKNTVAALRKWHRCAGAHMR